MVVCKRERGIPELLHTGVFRWSHLSHIPQKFAVLLGPHSRWSGLRAGDSTVHADGGSDVGQRGFGREGKVGSDVGEVELVAGGGGITLPRARQLKRQLGDIAKSHLRSEQK